MNSILAFVVGFILIGLVIFEGLYAWFDQMFFPSQVWHRWKQPGIAFVMHGGMWSDYIVLPFLFGMLINNYVDQWTTGNMVWAGVIGFAITLGNQIQLSLNQDKPDPIGWQKQWVSSTIALHFIYMWVACTVLALVYFFTPAVTATALMWTGIVLGLHLTFGIHLPLGVLNRFLKRRDLPEFLTMQAIVMGMLLWSAIGIVTYLRAGFETAEPVFLVGSGCLVVAIFVGDITEPVKA